MDFHLIIQYGKENSYLNAQYAYLPVEQVTAECNDICMHMPSQ